MFNHIRDPKIAKLNSLYTWGYLLACHSGMNQTINCVRHFKPLFRFNFWNQDPSVEDIGAPAYFSIAPPIA